MADHDAPVTKFNIYSGLLKAYQDKDQKRRLKTVASSTVGDRNGNQVTEAGIYKMADSAKNNMTIFLNHSYDVPEDVFGSVEDVTVSRRGDAVDMEFDIALNEANPRAVQTYDSIKNGTKLGTSIGANLLSLPVRNKQNGFLQLEDIELSEASIVGLPANPRTWVQYVMSSLDDKGIKLQEAPDPEPEIVAEAPEPDLEPTTGQDPLPDGENDLTDTVQVPDTQSEQPPAEVTAAAQSPTAQEVEETVPEDATEGEASDVQTVLASQHEFVTLLTSTVSELVNAKQQIGELEAYKARAAQELEEAKRIIDKIADLPIGRRTGFDEGIRDFRASFSTLYSEDFLKMLEKKPDDR